MARASIVWRGWLYYRASAEADKLQRVSALGGIPQQAWQFKSNRAYRARLCHARKNLHRFAQQKRRGAHRALAVNATC